MMQFEPPVGNVYGQSQFWCTKRIKLRNFQLGGRLQRWETFPPTKDESLMIILMMLAMSSDKWFKMRKVAIKVVCVSTPSDGRVLCEVDQLHHEQWSSPHDDHAMIGCGKAAEWIRVWNHLEINSLDGVMLLTVTHEKLVTRKWVIMCNCTLVLAHRILADVSLFLFVVLISEFSSQPNSSALPNVCQAGQVFMQLFGIWFLPTNLKQWIGLVLDVGNAEMFLQRVNEAWKFGFLIHF